MTNNKNDLMRRGLEWNPFHPDVPTSALFVDKSSESFLTRVERLVGRGGFALISGEVGSGKSSMTRLLVERLRAIRDVSVAVIDRPQSRLADFYRELGDIFGVALSVSNRWGGFKALRERWRAHLGSTLIRPVLIIDEAQSAPTEVLEELRILSSAEFDSDSLLTVIFSGDMRIFEHLRSVELAPLESRIRVRIILEPRSRDDLIALLEHAISSAGAPDLMTRTLNETIVDHAAGNCRALMQLASEVLEIAIEDEIDELDERLFFRTAGVEPRASKRKPSVTKSRI
jgi:general secretion pathway protein A